MRKSQQDQFPKVEDALQTIYESLSFDLSSCFPLSQFSIVINSEPNGLSQRQRRDWRDFFSIMHHFWQNAPISERRSRLPVPRTLRGPLEPVLGALTERKTR